MNIIRAHYRRAALDLLIERRPYRVGSPDWQYRTTAAWKLLQLAMGRPARNWTDVPPGPQYRGVM